MQLTQHFDLLKKQLIFITGPPRSGLSILTEVIDAHPEIAVLMENIFDNRQRWWYKAAFWNSSEDFHKEVYEAYLRLYT
jgi:hypothetical protein